MSCREMFVFQTGRAQKKQVKAFKYYDEEDITLSDCPKKPLE
jgi:hypothetical protein